MGTMEGLLIVFCLVVGLLGLLLLLVLILLVGFAVGFGLFLLMLLPFDIAAALSPASFRRRREQKALAAQKAELHRALESDPLSVELLTAACGSDASLKILEDRLRRDPAEVARAAVDEQWCYRQRTSDGKHWRTLGSPEVMFIRVRGTSHCRELFQLVAKGQSQYSDKAVEAFAVLLPISSPGEQAALIRAAVLSERCLEEDSKLRWELLKSLHKCQDDAFTSLYDAAIARAEFTLLDDLIWLLLPGETYGGAGSMPMRVLELASLYPVLVENAAPAIEELLKSRKGTDWSNKARIGVATAARETLCPDRRAILQRVPSPEPPPPPPQRRRPEY